VSGRLGQEVALLGHLNEERVTSQTFEGTLAALRRLGIDHALFKLLSGLPSTTPTYIVGGLPRDVVFSNFTGMVHSPKDVDIVIDTDVLEPLMQRVTGAVSRTPLGGFKWTPLGSDISIDIWQLRDTVWIKAYGLQPTIESFLAGVDLNVDRIAVGLHDQSVNDVDCRRAFLGGTIHRDGLHPVDSLRMDEYARALMASHKTHLRLSNECLSEISRMGNSFYPRAVKRLSFDGYLESQVKEAFDRIQT